MASDLLGRRWERRDAGNRRVVWECERDGLTLLVVRDARPLHYWWRVRERGKNRAKGNARDAMHARRLAEKAYRELVRGREVAGG